VSAVPRNQNLASPYDLAAMCGLRLSDIGHGGDSLPGQHATLGLAHGTPGCAAPHLARPANRLGTGQIKINKS
jgi:hypothetical protein